jgi:NAD(P)-dependent dehydrogenase (short-subunit alcohol dehydrogenase family)
MFASVISKYAPASIILATRDIAKAKTTANEITSVAPTVRTLMVELDLGSLEQVKTAADKINSLDENIDVIVNNAGIMAPPFSKTVDGIESQFATNHIGHFLLTNLLLPKILARNVPVRVVNVTSGGFRFGPPRFEDWNFDVRKPQTFSPRFRKADQGFCLGWEDLQSLGCVWSIQIRNDAILCVACSQIGNSRAGFCQPPPRHYPDSTRPKPANVGF